MLAHLPGEGFKLTGRLLLDRREALVKLGRSHLRFLVALEQELHLAFERPARIDGDDRRDARVRVCRASEVNLPGDRAWREPEPAANPVRAPTPAGQDPPGEPRQPRYEVGGRDRHDAEELEDRADNEQGCSHGAIISPLAALQDHQAVQRAARKAHLIGKGETLRVHDLRSGFACRQLEAGTGVNVVQSMLGHSSPAMTLSYARLVSGERVLAPTPLNSSESAEVIEIKGREAA